MLTRFAQSTDVKNSLSHWGLYRATSKDPSANSGRHIIPASISQSDIVLVPDGSRQFAPVPAALEDDLMRWSLEAAWKATNAPLEKRPKMSKI
jgi:hypothetical protein